MLLIQLQLNQITSKYKLEKREKVKRKNKKRHRKLKRWSKYKLIILKLKDQNRVKFQTFQLNNQSFK